MPNLNDADTEAAVETLRAFNRLYTEKLGLLRPKLDGSPYSLSEARILYELDHRGESTAADIARALRLDRAQLSRTLERFAGRELVRRRADPDHGRQQLVSLSEQGRAAFAELQDGTRRAVAELLGGVPAHHRLRLIEAAATFQCSLESAGQAPQIRMRGLQPGDLGEIVARQARLYAEEYGWHGSFETLIAGIVGAFQRGRDHAWIAELDGRWAGAVLLIAGETAKLRLLHVEAEARGLGIGRGLVQACIEQARTLGYTHLELWTQSVLTSAGRIYRAAGFQLVEEAPHQAFGFELMGQTWRLEL